MRWIPALVAASIASACARPAAPVASAAPAAAPETRAIACKDQRAWGTYLRDDRDATIAAVVAALERAGVEVTEQQAAALRGELKDIVKWRLIRFLLVDGDNHNFGYVELPGVATASGAPLRVYRTGFTPRPAEAGSCFRSLLDDGGVRHVVSLYAGEMPTRDLEAAERETAERAGASYFSARDADAAYSSWRETLRDHGDDPAVVRAAMEAVAALINEHVLRPGGAAPRGHVHVHCGGGMHRTGMVVGILSRCLGGASADDIEATYKRHVDWRSDDRPGGYEAENLAFIRDFDCGLLTPAGAPMKNR